MKRFRVGVVPRDDEVKSGWPMTSYSDDNVEHNTDK